jgi:hypothetical protein
MKDEIILYRPDELAEHIEVRIGEETVWLNRQQIAVLFGRDIKTIGKHLNNVFSEGELEKEVVVAKFATTTQHGAIKGKTQTMNVEFYNLDVIISVGYRVKSKQGTQFRIWANTVLKDYLLKGFALNQRMNRIENTVEMIVGKVKEIDLQIHSQLIPNQGVFFDGQVFDAYELASRIIRSATKSIVLIDNYIDESTLTHLAKKNQGVKVYLLTKSTSKQLTLDVQKANAQYGNFTQKPFNKSHDRFLIIDNNEVYHLGASLKDLGRKWFAFSKLETRSVESIMNEVKGLL